MMVLLTVIGRRLAKPGMEFIFTGPNSNCKDCKVKTICFHLEQGAKYRVLRTREIVHDCPLHEENVVIVEVEETSREAVIPKKQAHEGTTITIELPKCNFRGCQHYTLCFPIGMESGLKRQVNAVSETVECAIGQDRVRAVLE
ncbi:hypothetical protein DRJ16_07235 [Candidatus Woesearchaeota archaeon]|nr:MAG: hypothetical protein DRJ16_07235 [Candidatus Woesearchaeota archaeon]